jgi:hypothetical protein
MARSHGKTARQALERYVARCALACEAARGNDDGSLDAALRKVREAFHNFIAADHAALMEGDDLVRDAECRAMLREAQRSRESLMGALSEAKMKSVSEMARVKQALQIRNFRSSFGESQFEQKV